MNKYQEAFDFINKNLDLDTLKFNTILGNEMVSRIEELVDKATPMKVIHDNKHGSGIDCKNVDFYNCPRCRRRLRNKQHDNYCGRCGQRLNWSD